jgi:hypothetical protein
MRFAAGVTVTGILSLLLLEALKVIMVPVAGWIVGLLVILLKILLIGGVLLILGVMIAIGVFVYRRWKKSPVEV